MTSLSGIGSAGSEDGGQLSGRGAAGAALAAPSGTETRPTVSVIICAYTEDRWTDLQRAVKSVQGQTEAPEEIVLVVDHCPALFRRAQEEFSGVAVLANRGVKGLAGARNTGVAEACGDVVAFLDDDAMASPSWLATIADQYRDSRVAGVGGLVSPVWEVSRPRWFPPELDWVVGCSYRGQPMRRQPVRNFIGANMSFRREVFGHVDGFSAALGRLGEIPLGCEETEFCLRVHRSYPDSILLFEPAAVVRHWVRRQRASWRYLMRRCYAEGLSKAVVAKLAGTGPALESERSYVRSTIPAGVGRSLLSAARGRLGGILGAVALLAAVAVAAAGYASGLMGRSAAAGASAAGASSAEASAAGASASADGSRLARALRGAASWRPLPWAGLGLSLILWVIALAQLDLSGVQTSGLGLVDALPVTFWAAAAVLTVSFSCAVVRRPLSSPVLAGHLVTLVAILHATPTIVYGTLRYSWAWKHIGVIDYIIHHGVNFNLEGLLGVYQGWPGFFALNAFLTTGAGRESALTYASWALPVNDLLWLGPVLLIARAFTTDRRLIVTAAWLFELGNWVGQDYFSPQAFAYFLYLVVVAVCLRWLWDPGRASRQLLAGRPGPPVDGGGPSRAMRLALVLCMLPLVAAIASSHQLTPFMLLAALGMLALFGQLRARILFPLTAAAITAGWILYGGLPWLANNDTQILQGFGLPWGNTAAHLVGGSEVPADQMIVEWGARLLSVAIGMLAIVGFFRYRRRHGALARRSWNRTALLTIAAIPAAAANSYGGEIIFRVFMFSLPFMVLAAAAAFFPGMQKGRSVWTGLALTVISLGLVAGFSLGNYGQAAINYFTPQEVAASQWLYRTAPKGALMVSINSNYPWAFVHYNWYGYEFLDSPPALSQETLQAPVPTVTRLMRPGRSPASYLIFTTSQAEEDGLTGVWPIGTMARISRDLIASGEFRVVYRNADVLILQLSGSAGAPALGAAP